MNDLISTFKAEQKLLIKLLEELSQQNIQDTEAQQLLKSVRVAFEEYELNKKKDLYPILIAVAKTDSSFKQKLDIIDQEALVIRKDISSFFDKYAIGGSENDFKFDLSSTQFAMIKCMQTEEVLLCQALKIQQQSHTKQQKQEDSGKIVFKISPDKLNEYQLIIVQTYSMFLFGVFFFPFAILSGIYAYWIKNKVKGTWLYQHSKRLILYFWINMIWGAISVLLMVISTILASYYGQIGWSIAGLIIGSVSLLILWVNTMRNYFKYRNLLQQQK